MALQCAVGVEDAFGPIVHGCGSDFDFTLLFEESILFILPLVLASALAVLELVRRYQHDVLYKGGFLLPLKLIAWTGLLASQAAFLGIAATHGPRTRLSTAAGGIGISLMLVLLCCSYFQHRHAVRTGSVLVLYLFSTLPMDVLRCRTVWSTDGGRAASVSVIIYAAFKLCALALEVVWKCGLATRSGLCDAPEEKHGIMERSLVVRMISTFRKGYKTPLELKDLYDIGPRLLTGNMPHIDTSRLAVDIFTSHIPEILDPIFPRACYLGCQLAQPFLLERAIDLISNPNQRNFYLNGGGLIAAYGLVYIGIAVTASAYETAASRAATVVRGDLVTRVFQQSLGLDRVMASKDSSTTMITADVERVQLGVRKMHDLWANILTIAIGLWLVDTFLGSSSLLILSLVVVSIALVAWFAGLASKFQNAWMEAMEQRLQKIVQIFKGIKSIKQIGASEPIFDMLKAEREHEIGLSKPFRSTMVAVITLSFSSLVTLPFLALVLPVALSNGSSGRLLDARATFSALSMLALVSSAIQDGAAHGMQLMSAFGSLGRLQTILTENQWKDVRQRSELESSNASTAERRSSPRLYPLNEKESSEATSISEEDTCSASAAILDAVTPKLSDEQKVEAKAVSFRVPRNQLTVIYGPTGSGKSTLLRLMTGDSAPASGRVMIENEHVGFVDQPPWIANLSIKDNIVGPLPFEEKRYQTAVEVCALDRDIGELGGGHDHLCGLSGQSLSGGQKARIALARVIYSRAEIVILDDCFVALDAPTERHVLSHAFGPNGALSSRTAILATSSQRYLSWAAHAIILDADFGVIREGPPSEVVPNLNDMEHGDLKQTPLKPADSEQEDKMPEPAQEDDKVTNLSSSELAVYWWYLKNAGLLNFGLFALLCSMFVAGAIYPQVFIKSWTEKTLTQQKATIDSFYGVLLGVGGMACVAFAGACIYMFRVMAVKMAASIHTALLRTMLDASMEFFSTIDSGRTLNRFSQDLQIIDMELPLAFIGTTMTILMLVAQCIIIVVQAPWTGLVVLAMLLALCGIVRIYLRTSRRLRLLDIESKSPILSLLLEAIDGLGTVRSLGWSHWYVKRGLVVLRQAQIPFHLLQTAQVALSLSLDTLVAIVAVSVIAIAIGTNSSSGGGLGLALLNVVGLGQSIGTVVHFYTLLEITLGAVARVRDFTTQTTSENLGRRLPPSIWPGRGAVRFQNVTLSHSSSLPPAVEDFSLSIEPGTKVAICGRTGSGKTTIVNSLLLLVNVLVGTIIIDGEDISTMQPKAVRSRLVAVPQEILKLSVSIGQYSKLYGIEDEEDVIRGLMQVGLWRTVERAGGLNMLMTDDSLSTGQRQLLGMTLACLRKGTVVLMDEPTSHGDIDIQSQLQRIISATFADSTVICITHQVKTIVDFDIVIVLDSGKIVEQGNPKELLSLENSKLKGLFQDEG